MKIHVEFDTDLAPEGVIGALTDFTERRTEIWPNLDPAVYEVHELGDTWAVVTEGSPRPKVWAKERYDWSQPGRVSWTVQESNFCTPGSGVAVEVSAAHGGGSRVALDWERHPSNVKGRVIMGMMRVMGPAMLRSTTKKSLDALASEAT